MDQQRAPMLEALEAYHAIETVSFSIPAHKGGRAVDDGRARSSASTLTARTRRPTRGSTTGSRATRCSRRSSSTRVKPADTRLVDLLARTSPTVARSTSPHGHTRTTSRCGSTSTVNGLNSCRCVALITLNRALNHNAAQSLDDDRTATLPDTKSPTAARGTTLLGRSRGRPHLSCAAVVWSS
jgi:hypothetical protein